ncbi:MAG: hypothetical protein HOH65_13305 [Rhodospirillaceae bacterium]|jgi:hypothetical protein|nr:hypothetical protein [Rhodospirillaceae bacterium]
MAIRPTSRNITGPGTSRVPARQAPRPASRQVPVAETEVRRAAVQSSLPSPGFRLRTAVTDGEIDTQIARLMQLIANDNIDPDAPPGSYLNFLI